MGFINLSDENFKPYVIVFFFFTSVAVPPDATMKHFIKAYTCQKYIADETAVKLSCSFLNVNKSIYPCLSSLMKVSILSLKSSFLSLSPGILNFCLSFLACVCVNLFWSFGVIYPLKFC